MTPPNLGSAPAEKVGPHHFWLALGFYTRLPCPKTDDYRWLPQAAVFLPLVGWIVGAVSAVSFYLAAGLWTPTVAAIAALTAGIWTTGAFHEDGFADVCDGFGGGYGKQRILEIMKDSAIGVYGALGLILLMSLKISLLGSLPIESVPGMLLAGHSLSRAMPLLLMRRYRYARSENSKAGGAVFVPSFAQLGFAGLAGLLPMLLLPWPAQAALLPVTLSCLGLGRYFHRHIGGYTGDCLGACQQVAETVFYLSVSAAWKFT